MVGKFKKRVYEIIEVADRGDTFSKVVDNFLLTLIILNILVLIVETVPEVPKEALYYFHIFDLISLGIFSLEYLLRLWSCTSDPEYRHPVKGRFAFATRMVIILDLIAIAPIFFPLLGLDLRFTRIGRLFRIMRLGKLVRYIGTFKTLSRVFKKKKKEFISSGIILIFSLVLSSCLMYYAEHTAQPDNFGSIPKTMWWSIVTLTTVGYGDTFPITLLGKIVAAFISILGIFTFALPTAILGAAFIEESSAKVSARKKTRTCPKCEHKFKD